jgi:hypothetical protein
MLTRAVSAKRFEPIARWGAEVPENQRLIDEAQLPQRDGLDIDR